MPVKKSNTDILTLILAAWFVSNGALAAELTNEAIEARIRGAKVFKEEREIKATFKDPEIEVNITSPDSENEKDKKINAVLIAKNVLPLSKDALRVRVRFYPQQQNMMFFDEITITIADVKYFADGKESPDSLIKSIVVERKSQEPQTSPPEPQTGPLHKVITRIENKPKLLSKVLTRLENNPPIDRADTVPPNIKPQMSPEFQTLHKNAVRLGHYGRLISIAKGFRSLELAGTDTSRQHRRFVVLLNELQSNQPNVGQDISDLIDLMLSAGFSLVHPPPPLRGAVDSQHWQDNIALLSNRIRSQLQDDTPTLDGYCLGDRVRAAAQLHVLARKGQDVTVFRQRLQEIDQHCQGPAAEPFAAVAPIQELEKEMGFF